MKFSNTKPPPNIKSPLRMAKNGKNLLIVGVFLTFLMISLVSAWDWDNVKSYDKDTKTITIDNALGLGGTIATAKLLTDQHMKVLEGDDVLVAEIEISSNSIYNNALKKLEFYNYYGRGKQNRDFTYKKKVVTSKLVDNYQIVCSESGTALNGSTLFNCKPTLVGKVERETITWEELGSTNLKEETIIIGIFTDVKAGERTEWIPTLFGVEIDEWADFIGFAKIEYYEPTSDDGGQVCDSVNGGKFAQTFTLGTTGTNGNYDLEGVAIMGYKGIGDSPGLITVAITPVNASARPDLPDITVGNFSADALTENVAGEQINVTNFNVTAQLNSSIQYGITVTGSAACGTDFFIKKKNAGTYSGGIGMYTLGNYNNYVDDSTDDWWFQVWGTQISGGEVGLIEPVDYANLSSSSILLNASSNYTTQAGHGVTNMTLWLDGMLNTTIYNTTAQQNLTLGTTLTIADGFHSWIVSASTADNVETNSTNWSFTVDTISPAVNIIYPTVRLDYGVSGDDEYVNWTVSDTNLNGCWVDYNGANSTILCADLNDSFTLVDGVYTVRVWANDTVENIGTDTQTWTYDVFETSNTYSASVVESTTNNFDLGLNYTSASWDSIAGNVWYNNTKYAAVKVGSGDAVNFTRNITAPSVATAINKSFHWEVNLVNVTGTYSRNSSTNLQLVSPINMSLCNYPHTVPYINFTIYDEDTLVETNGTIELTFTYRGVDALATSSKTFSFSNTTGNESRYSFCFDPPDTNYTVDSILQYAAPGYTNKFYNFEGITFSNTTTEIGLYLLDTDNSTSFIIEVKDSNYQALEGVEVYIQRFYPASNTWYTVEIVQTDDDGETVQHVYTEDALYRFKIYDDGTLLYTSASKLITCPEQPCTVTIVLSETLGNPVEDFQELAALESSLSYDSSTHQVTFTYTDTSGNFTQARLYVIRRDYGSTGIGHSCNITSTSDIASLGGINCDLTSSTNGTYMATGYIRRGGNEIIVEREYYSKIRDIVGGLGLDGVLIGFFFLIGIVMLGVYRPSIGIIFTIIGIFLLQLLQIMSLSVTFLVAIIGVGVIILLEVRKQ